MKKSLAMLLGLIGVALLTFLATYVFNYKTNITEDLTQKISAVLGSKNLQLGCNSVNCMNLNLDGRDVTLAGVLTEAVGESLAQEINGIHGVRVASVKQDDVRIGHLKAEAEAKARAEAAAAAKARAEAETAAKAKAEAEARAAAEAKAKAEAQSAETAAAARREAEKQATLAAMSAKAQACQAKFAELASDKINFRISKASISKASLNLIKQYANTSKECPETKIYITGHTDSRGISENNQQLSLARAEAVKAALVSEGVATDLLVTAGKGSEEPVASNKTVEGRWQNRRIEFSVVAPQ